MKKLIAVVLLGYTWFGGQIRAEEAEMVASGPILTVPAVKEEVEPAPAAYLGKSDLTVEFDEKGAVKRAVRTDESKNNAHLRQARNQIASLAREVGALRSELQTSRQIEQALIAEVKRTQRLVRDLRAENASRRKVAGNQPRVLALDSPLISTKTEEGGQEAGTADLHRIVLDLERQVANQAIEMRELKRKQAMPSSQPLGGAKGQKEFIRYFRSIGGLFNQEITAKIKKQVDQRLVDVGLAASGRDKALGLQAVPVAQNVSGGRPISGHPLLTILFFVLLIGKQSMLVAVMQTRPARLAFIPEPSWEKVRGTAPPIFILFIAMVLSSVMTFIIR